MDKLRNYLIICMLLTSGLAAVITTKAWTRLPFRSLIDCSELGITNLAAATGEATCESRYYLFGQYYSVLLKKIPGPNPLKFLISGFQNKFSLSGQALQAPPGKLYVTDMAGKSVWVGSGTGTDWSSATRVLIELPKDSDQFILSLPNNTEYNLILTSTFRKELRTNFFDALTVIMLLASLVIFLMPSRNPWLKYAVLTSWLALIVLWYGMPYGSTTGWFDPGDDTSYMHWAYNLGYLLDPDLTHSAFIPSWSLNHNHHSWGTGLILAPFVLPSLLMGSGLRPGIIHFGLMNFGVIFCGCLAVVMLFRAFSLISSWRPALLVAVLSLLSTSMLKWMFIRNFFSHVPEFFALSFVTYFALQRFYKGRADLFYFVCMLLFMVLAVQVRRENIALFGLLMIFEFLHVKHPTVKIMAKYIASLALFAVVSYAILMGTNYFTQLKSFFGNSSTQQYFRTSNLWQVFCTQGPDVFYRESFGLFYWKNAYPWLAVMACVLNWKAWRWWLPLAGTTLVYLLMCTFYEYPNGFEWQSRFLLKLNPILFAGALIFLTSAPKALKIIGWSWMFLAGYFEYGMYLTQKPGGMNFYIADFSDHMLKYPQRFPGISVTIFYLPLIVVWCCAFGMWLKVYLTDRSAQTSL